MTMLITREALMPPPTMPPGDSKNTATQARADVRARRQQRRMTTITYYKRAFSPSLEQRESCRAMAAAGAGHIFFT